MGSSLRAAGRWLILMLLVPALLAVTACSGTPEASGDASTRDRTVQTATATSGPATEATATVTDTGFTLEVGDLTARAPAGVAPAGTRVTLALVPLPEDAQQAGLTAAGGAFDISFEGGVQPAVPVTIEVELDEPADPDEPLAFITQDSETGEWNGLPVRIEGQTASVQLEHFSFGFFSWFGDFTDQFTDQILRFAQMRHDPPDCHGQTPEIDGRTYTASTDNDAVYVCVQDQDGRALLTVHSNSPYVWEVRPDTATAHGQWAGEEGPLAAAQVVTVAVFNLMHGYDYDDATVLVPGGRAPVLLHEGATSTTAVARVDAGLGLIAIASAGIGMLSNVGVTVPYESLVSVGECAASVLTTGIDPDAVEVIRTVLGCVGTAVSGIGGMIIAGLISVVPLLATQITGIIGEFTGDNTARISVTSEPVGPPVFEVPEYCDQPVRSLPIGETDLEGMYNWLSGPMAWPAAGQDVVSLVCTAGGVTWPGVLVFSGADGSRTGEIFLSDLEPSVYRGGFDIDQARVEGERLVVPYRWQDSGGMSGRHGEVTISWDGSPVVEELGGVDSGPLDWRTAQYHLTWSDEPEHFVDGCSRGPIFANCVVRIEAVAVSPDDPARAAVIMYGHDSEGFPLEKQLALWTSTGGVRTSTGPASGATFPEIGCTAELTWIDDDRLAAAATDCPEAGDLGTYSVLGSELRRE